MKKFLISAAGLAALTLGAEGFADHNYVGLKAGWLAARGGTKTSVRRDAANTQYKGRGKDSSAFLGAFVFGRSFTQDNGAWFVEAELGKDSSNLKAKRAYGITAADISSTGTLSVKRKFFLDLGAGYSHMIRSGVSVYGKLSVLFSSFGIRESDIGTNNGVAMNEGGSKTKNAFGLAPTVGVSKDFGSFSLRLSYSFAWYQQLKLKGAFRQGGGVTQPGDGFSASVRPTYHIVAMTLAKKI